MSDTTARPGWWTCFVCQPNTHDRGGQAAWMAHYMREHWTEHYMRLPWVEAKP